MMHPFMPTLYDDPVVITDYNFWVFSHVWLHKQPLFLWQIALSYKLFGVNEFTTRIPSVVLSSLLVSPFYRTGKILGNKKIGFYASLLLVTSFYLMELISGCRGTDHNDVSFMAYISLSFWCWIEYINSKKKRWLVLVGLFSGFAVLCKWIVGLLVYISWAAYAFKENRWKLLKYKDIGISFVITFVIAFPWQLYTYLKYPVEYRSENLYNITHFFAPLEGHSGDYFYYLAHMHELYGGLVPYLIIPGLIVFYRRSNSKSIFTALFVTIFAVFVFFSLAETKLSSYTLVLILPIFIIMAFFMDYLVSLIEKLKLLTVINRVIFFVALLLLIIMRIDYKSWHEKYSFRGPDNEYLSAMKHNKNVFESLQLPKNAVVFNVLHNYTEAMFYTGLPVYGFIPSKEQYLDLKNKNRIVALFRPKDQLFPPYLQEDKSTIMLNDTIKAIW